MSNSLSPAQTHVLTWLREDMQTHCIRVWRGPSGKPATRHITQASCCRVLPLTGGQVDVWWLNPLCVAVMEERGYITCTALSEAPQVYWLTFQGKCRVEKEMRRRARHVRRAAGKERAK